MILKTEFSAHWYTAEGLPAHDADLRRARKDNLLPSVTSILKVYPKGVLDTWKNEQFIRATLAVSRWADEADAQYYQRIQAEADRPMREAGEFGTLMHATIEDWHTDGTKPVLERVQPYFAHYLEWANKTISTIEFSEKVLVNIEQGYAGTCDLKCTLADGRTCLLDFKTQKVKARPNFYETWAMQLAAYGQVSPAQVYMSVVINSEKPEAPRIKEWSAEDINQSWKTFMLCRDLWCAVKDYYPKAKG